MKNATNSTALPSQIGELLKDDKFYIDNIFADAWKFLKVNSQLAVAGFSKRSGTEVEEVVFLLMLRTWFNNNSIALFACEAMRTFSDAGKDVLYSFLRREDISWRVLNLRLAKRVFRVNGLDDNETRAFVLDDSIKQRRGKKMEGISSHFDHVSNRHVMGQQVLTLGVATDKAFLPVDSQLCVSKTRAMGLKRPYQDGRSVVARRYREATEQTKLEMAANMITRALRVGLNATYLVADAWFGNRAMVRTALSHDLCPILRMKKDKLQYRVVVDGTEVLLDAKELYRQVVKGNWEKVPELPWLAVSLTVELNLAVSRKDTPEWRKVQLLFVRGLKEVDESEVSKKDWALFLTTDTELSMNKMLEVYALRWGIEVYFKEAKQHLGLLSEQTTNFASHTASIHLCAIRYLMLVHAKFQRQEARVGVVRAKVQEQLNMMSFAGRLWAVFRAIISGALHQLHKELGCSAATVMELIDQRINDFFVQSLQLDAFTLRLEYE